MLTEYPSQTLQRGGAHGQFREPRTGRKAFPYSIDNLSKNLMSRSPCLAHGS
jgi:hypothetical protein